MFNKKNDPLVDSVKSVMNQGELFREIEKALLEEYNIQSRKALPHELQPEFDAVLAEAKKCAMEELIGKQHKIDVNKNEKIDSHDFKLLRTKKKMGLNEKAVSKAQHRFFGLVRGIQKGEAKGSEKAEKAAKEMSVKQVRDYAKTKEKGLPEKIDEKLTPEAKQNVRDAVGPKRDPKMVKKVMKIAMSNPKNMMKESVIEEIRRNLEEQLATIHESGDEAAFTDFIASLTEEQIEILGLNENEYIFEKGSAAMAKTKAADILNPPSTPERAGARPEGKMPAPSAPEAKPGSFGMGDRGAGPAPTKTPSPTDSGTMAGMPGGTTTSVSDPAGTAPARLSSPERAGARPEGRNPALSTRSPESPSQRPGVNKPPVMASRPKPAMKPIPKPASKAPEQDDWKSRVFSSMNESSRSGVMKESFESFLRNKFLKG